MCPLYYKNKWKEGERSTLPILPFVLSRAPSLVIHAAFHKKNRHVPSKHEKAPFISRSPNRCGVSDSEERVIITPLPTPWVPHIAAHRSCHFKSTIQPLFYKNNERAGKTIQYNHKKSKLRGHSLTFFSSFPIFSVIEDRARCVNTETPIPIPRIYPLPAVRTNLRALLFSCISFCSTVPLDGGTIRELPVPFDICFENLFSRGAYFLIFAYIFI